MFSHVNESLDKGAWLVAAFGVVAVALSLDLLIRHDPISVDFHTYIAAGQVGVQDGWSHIYDQALVAVEQSRLSPDQRVQPFLSPPTVAFITAPLTPLPYKTAYVVWAAFLFFGLAAALVWASVSTGWSRWIAVVGALGPWWVMHAINVGQVAPLVAAGTVVAWRFARDRRDVYAGLAMVAILLKPNTAILVPFALLCAWRWRAFATWVGATLAVATVVLLSVGLDGTLAYITQLRGHLPSGADSLTLQRALGVPGLTAAVLRVLIVGAVLAASFRLRQSPGLVVPLAIVGSLVIAPYLHGSDLVMLAVAGWMVWEEHPRLAWRVPLAIGWFLASPYLYLRGESPHLGQWPWLEMAFLLALVVSAWTPLTAWAESRRRATA